MMKGLIKLVEQQIKPFDLDHADVKEEGGDDDNGPLQGDLDDADVKEDDSDD